MRSPAAGAKIDADAEAVGEGLADSLDAGVGAKVPRPGEGEGTGALGSPAISAAAVVAHIEAATTLAAHVSATARRVEPTRPEPRVTGGPIY
ncbi:hypothetical protein LBMAG15_09470 [Actinomycetes bacterium]|nr:hypothetical protein LBMAG15_09470 [Actinomycetes bacterium]